MKKMDNSSNYEVQNLKIDKEIDLKGRVCPMTFVYTKVALEKMESKQILKVILDFSSAFKNVPKSVEKQKLGKIIKTTYYENICELIIQKT